MTVVILTEASLAWLYCDGSRQSRCLISNAFVRSRVLASISLISEHGRQCGMSGMSEIIQPARRDLSEVAGTDANEGKDYNAFRK